MTSGTMPTSQRVNVLSPELTLHMEERDVDRKSVV